MAFRSERSGWDLRRFVKTLSYYGAVPLLSQLDWFQRSWGSQPHPKVDSRAMMAAMNLSPGAIGATEVTGATGATGATGETRDKPAIGVAGETGVVGRQVVQQLAAQGIRTLSAKQISSAEPLAEATAVICDGSAISEADIAQIILQVGPKLWVQRPIFDFTQPSPDLQQIWQQTWGALDDVVMGGVSQSNIQFSDGLADFSGQVSTANSGGFASVRTRNLEPALDLSRYAGVVLRVRGDGQRYKFMLRAETNWDGVAYCFSFDTVANTWITVRIPFTALTPVFRARTLPNQTLDPSQVCAWQLMLSKFEYDGALNPHFTAGAFQLQVASIQVYRQPECARLVLISPSPDAAQYLAASDLAYSLIYPGPVVESPTGQPLRLKRLPSAGQSGVQNSGVQNSREVGAPVSAVDLAALSIAALNYPASCFSVGSAGETGSCAAGDWDCLFEDSSLGTGRTGI